MSSLQEKLETLTHSSFYIRICIFNRMITVKDDGQIELGSTPSLAKAGEIVY